MDYKEFKDFKEIKDNNFVKKFTDGEHSFFIEPAFYTQLQGLEERYPNDHKKVVEEMIRQIKSHKLIAFVYDFESPFLDYNDAILREFVDITDAVHVFYEDKSRGSDYGD